MNFFQLGSRIVQYSIPYIVIRNQYSNFRLTYVVFFFKFNSLSLNFGGWWAIWLS